MKNGFYKEYWLLWEDGCGEFVNIFYILNKRITPRKYINKLVREKLNQVK